MGEMLERNAAGSTRIDVRRFLLPSPTSLNSATLSWKVEGACGLAAPAGDLLEALDGILKVEGFKRHGRPHLVRHRVGDRGLPPVPNGGAFGFILDLSDARRTADGGLLLFDNGSGLIRGWRPEAGFLTFWPSETPPQLTELNAGSPDRYSLVGAANAL
jgi:hypothetical protein